MAEIGMSRDEQKRRLRENVIENNEQGDRKTLSPFAIAVIIILTVAAFAAFAWFINRESFQAEYQLLWRLDSAQDEGPSESFKACIPFRKGVVRYTRDGAMYADNSGRIIWERSYQMSAPFAAASDDYVVLADRNGTNAYIFNESENTGTISTTLPLSQAVVSDQGVVYAVLNDEEAEYIHAYRPDGSVIDLSVKSVFTGDGYPFDLDVSPDGSQLITAYLKLEDEALESHVVFRNFGEVGQNEDARRIVGGFHEEFAGHMVGKVHFFDNEHSLAVYDGGAAFFSTRVLNRPELTQNVVLDQKISAVACGKRLAAFLLEKSEDAPAGIRIYSPEGKKLGEVETELHAEGLEVSDRFVFLWNRDSLYVYGKDGSLKAELHPEELFISSAAGVPGSREIILSGGGSLIKIGF